MNEKANIQTEDYQYPLTCGVCGGQTPDVMERECGYARELWDREELEIICDSCEHEHLMDI